MAEIGEELMCPICHSEFQDAVIIQCHHSFCRRCITTWINQSSAQRAYRCPVCKYVNEIHELQKSFPVEQMFQFMNKTKSKTKSLTHPECQNHPGEHLALYCCDCKEFACINCIIHHPNHLLESVKEVAGQMRKEIESFLDKAMSRITQTEDRLLVIEDCISQIDKEQKLAIENCYKRVDKLKSQIAILARKTVHEIEQRIECELQTPMDQWHCTSEILHKNLDNHAAILNLYHENNDFKLITNYNQMLTISSTFQNDEVEDLPLPRHKVDHKRLYETSNLKLTDLIDAELILGKVSANSAEQQLEITEPPVRSDSQTPDNPERNRPIRSNGKRSDSGTSENPGRNKPTSAIGTSYDTLMLDSPRRNRPAHSNGTRSDLIAPKKPWCNRQTSSNGARSDLLTPDNFRHNIMTSSNGTTSDSGTIDYPRSNRTTSAKGTLNSFATRKNNSMMNLSSLKRFIPNLFKKKDLK